LFLAQRARYAILGLRPRLALPKLQARRILVNEFAGSNDRIVSFIRDQAFDDLGRTDVEGGNAIIAVGASDLRLVPHAPITHLAFVTRGH
jgi:hypothetical protein